LRLIHWAAKARTTVPLSFAAHLQDAGRRGRFRGKENKIKDLPAPECIHPRKRRTNITSMSGDDRSQEATNGARRTEFIPFRKGSERNEFRSTIIWPGLSSRVSAPATPKLLPNPAQ
jgi:hypothetical protein